MSEQVVNLNELWEKILKVKIGMFTTVDAKGNLSSRPMTSQEIDVDGILWFFTSLQSDVARELSERPQVNISFAEPKDSFYASLAGQATLVTDGGVKASLWNPLVKAWFPLGLDDPNLALIRFEIDVAEYWDSDSSRMVQLLQIMKAAVTGTGSERVSNHGSVQL